MTWAEEFSHGYDEWTAGVTEDIDFYVGLAAEAGGPVVELAIGSGRVAVPIALATGRTGHRRGHITGHARTRRGAVPTRRAWS